MKKKFIIIASTIVFIFNSNLKAQTSLTLDYNSPKFNCKIEIPKSFFRKDFERSGNPYFCGNSYGNSFEEIHKAIENDLNQRENRNFLNFKIDKEFKLKMLSIMVLNADDWIKDKNANLQKKCISHIFLNEIDNYNRSTIINNNVGFSLKILKYPLIDGLEKIFNSKLTDESSIIDLFKIVSNGMILKKEDFDYLNSVNNKHFFDFLIKNFRLKVKFSDLSLEDKTEILKNALKRNPRTLFENFVIENFDYNTFFKPVQESLDEQMLDYYDLKNVETYQFMAWNLELKYNYELFKKIFLSDKISRNKIMAIIHQVGSFPFKNEILSKDICAIGKNLSNRFKEADISTSNQKIIDEFHDFKIDCLSQAFDLAELYSTNNDKYFNNWCIQKKLKSKCKLYFTEDWLSKVKTCKANDECDSMDLPFQVNKTNFIDESKYFASNIKFINNNRFEHKELPGKSVCIKKQCQVDLPYCDTTSLFNIMLKSFVNRDDNRCKTDLDCTKLEKYYNDENSFKLYLPITVEDRKFTTQEKTTKINDIHINFWVNFDNARKFCPNRFTPEHNENKNKFFSSFEKNVPACINNFCSFKNN